LIGERRDERGSALLGVILLLMLMSALAAALSVSGETETLISRNQRNGAQALAAAEAGLNHSVDLAIAYILGWKSNTLGSAAAFGSADAAVDALLSGADGDPLTVDDNGGFDARAGIDADEEIPLGTNLPLGNLDGVTYTAIIMDDDATAPAAHAENGDLLDDGNQVLIIRATGFARDNTTVTLEATISPFPFPALATNDDLSLSGSFQILGDAGGAHSNQDLEGDGNAGTIEQMATASGDYDYSDPDIDGHGGAPRMPIPPINAGDYLPQADYILKADGTMVTVATGVICSSPCNDWSFVGGEWRLNGGGITGTYYAETDLDMSGNVGPISMTLLSEGSIDISGGVEISPALPNVLLVANGDIKMAGNPGSTMVGRIMAHEQIDIAGNSTITAQILAEDATNVHSLVDENRVHGSVTITYDGGLNDDFWAVSGWREVR
jgi:hypothetical protein